MHVIRTKMRTILPVVSLFLLFVFYKEVEVVQVLREFLEIHYHFQIFQHCGDVYSTNRLMNGF